MHEPLLTYHRYNLFISLAKLEREQAVEEAKKVLATLPIGNRSLLGYLLTFFHYAASLEPSSTTPPPSRLPANLSTMQPPSRYRRD
eukprot:g5024.t1